MNESSETRIIKTIEIDDALAKELSDLLIRQQIRQDVLNALAKEDNMTAFINVEKKLVPIVARIEAIKTKINEEYIPQEYQSDNYLWNYSGYAIDKNTITLSEATTDLHMV